MNSIFNLKPIFLFLIKKYKLYKNKKYEYNILLEFFDDNTPCPGYILKCEELREEFSEKIKDIKSQTEQCLSCRIQTEKLIIAKKLLAAQTQINNDVNNDQLMLDFFNFEMACPQNIPFCEQLRQKYKEELDKLTITGCSTCKKNTLKAKYIKEIWENHISKTI
jgi:hypothetical protein